MNDFHDDDAWQRQQRDEILAPGFYKKHAYDGRYVFVDKGRFASIMQKRFAVDTIVQRKEGRAVCIEEKIVRWKGRVYRAFFLETKSCTNEGLESPGWMVYGEADFLLYCFQQENGDLLCYLIDFQALKAWFWPHEQIFPGHRMEKRNRTFGRLVSVAIVGQSVQAWKFAVPRPALIQGVAQLGRTPHHPDCSPQFRP